MADEPTDIASRRRKAEAAPAPSASAGRRGGDDGERNEKPPPLWRWFSAQVAHSDPDRAAAARAIRERWDLPTRRFSSIDRALAGEDSVHLTPFRQLLDEYRVTFGIGDDDEEFARQTGTAGALIPFGPEKCEDCTRDAVPGTGKCGRHGGQWISPAEQAQISRWIRDKVLVMSESALRVLQDLMDNGKSEQVRMMAATAVLDRAGVGPHMNINHSGEVLVTESDKAAKELRVRLERLFENSETKKQLLASAAEGAESGEEPVDAEVVAEA